MDFLSILSFLEWVIVFLGALVLLLLFALFGERFKPLMRFFSRKPINSNGSVWLTLDSYNNRRPDWFIEWEKRHDKTHDRIGANIKEVGDEVKKVGDKLGDISEAVARIDERTKKSND